MSDTLCASSAGWLAGAVAAVCLSTSPLLAADAIDLTKAVVVADKTATGPQAQAVRMLVEECQKRTQIAWAVADAWPEGAPAVIVVGRAPFVDATLAQHALKGTAKGRVAGAEGYQVRVVPGQPAVVAVAGNDVRGVLFGVGRLLRELRMARQHVGVPAELNVATVPTYPLRGHQLGYRPKTNSYDAWSAPMWEQYIRDLAVFGTNAVELLPPRSDDAADSPHFPLPQMPMMVEMSRLLDQYGLDVWIWYPAMDADYSKPATVKKALAEWANVFRQLPRVDAVFVPGGDPGHTDPAVLLPFLEQQTANLHRYHPQAQMWVSPQSFNQKWLDSFLVYLKTKQPDWLSGIVYGPQIRITLPELRAAVPKKYPLRRYPDITHSIQCQFPVQDWDTAYAVTEGREVINPRPQAEAQIFHAWQHEAIGFISYSEGCNDDVNKIVWSGLAWDPDRPVLETLREYGRYFISDTFADDFAQGLLALEQNWRGPLIANAAVMTTLQQFQGMERAATPAVSLNWRFQQALYRAYYDAFVYSRLVYETGLEQQALNHLSTANRTGSLLAMTEAENVLDRALVQPPAAGLRARVFELGDMLFQSIRMQLSVTRHKAIAVDRGATLDTIDDPLNNRLWLERRFEEIRGMADDDERLYELRKIVRWTDPGPGGFYDDLGNVTRQPHLLPGVGFKTDPGCYRTPRFGYVTSRTYHARFPKSSWDNVEMLYDGPLKMQYDRLDPHAAYTVRISYVGDSPRTKIRLLADEKYVIHPEQTKPREGALIEYDIPREATRDGRLTLTWLREQGLGGNGRGCAVAEIWLIKKTR
ncbi:MAG TPA: hypothetical protein VMR25_26460 [Planctomycetaceae bacterium]|nr:hypothetical protein [Planctomycetaceae bacterium]